MRLRQPIVVLTAPPGASGRYSDPFPAPFPMPCVSRRTRRSIGAVLALTAAMLSQPSAAWGPLGHRAVGAVADALLTPDARIEVAR